MYQHGPTLSLSNRCALGCGSLRSLDETRNDCTSRGALAQGPRPVLPLVAARLHCRARPTHSPTQGPLSRLAPDAPPLPLPCPEQVTYLGVKSSDLERMLHRLRSHWKVLPATIILMMSKTHSEDLATDTFPGCSSDCECVRHPSRCRTQRCIQRYRCAGLRGAAAVLGGAGAAL
jgi:hypothetical protein